jgi:hypothetical protein
MTRIVCQSLDARGSFAWQPGPSDPKQRSSTAIVTDAGTALVDPVDGEGLDAALAPLPPVCGIVSLLDRHQRDAALLAERLGVPRMIPRALGGPGVTLPGVEERTVVTRRYWREALLWLADRRLLVCAETLGTASFDLARARDPIGLHPLSRLSPPRRVFAGIEPEVIAVGHGEPLTDGAADALRDALRTARVGLPLNVLRLLPEVVRALRDARRARQ